MVKERNPLSEYSREQDLMFQHLEERKDRALFVRLKDVSGKNLSNEEIWDTIAAFRLYYEKKGMTVSEAKISGDNLLTTCLDEGWFDEHLNVKD